MFKFIKAKLNRKLTVLCLILAIVICASSCISGYILYRNATYKSYNDFAYEIADVAMSFIDGDKIATYLEPQYYGEPGCSNYNAAKTFLPDEDYLEMQENLYKLYKNTSIGEYMSGIYIAVPFVQDGEYYIRNIFDVRVAVVYEDESLADYLDAFDIGGDDPLSTKHPEAGMIIFETGERFKSGNTIDDYMIHETKYGYNSTACLPIKDSNGNSVALLFTDMPMPHVAETLNTFLRNTIIITVLVVLIFIGLFIRITRSSVTKPLALIASEADAFTDSDIQVSEKLKEVKQTDEIGQLADSVYRMENDIKTYVENLTQVTAEKERIGAELDVATNIQKSMLPCIFPAFPEVPEIDIYATMDPAKEVGGDFYDFFMVDDTHLAIVVADVSGKGVPAALFMVIGKTLIKDHTQPGRPVNEVFNEVNNLLCESNEGGLFITAFEAVLDLVTGEFTFVNAGHETPFICKKNGNYEPYPLKPGFVLAGMEGMKYKMGTITLEEGDKFFQYTDGVAEATDAHNELYGMERLEKVLNENTGATPEQLLPKVKEDIDKFVGDAPQFDDITMLSLEFRRKMAPKA